MITQRRPSLSWILLGVLWLGLQGAPAVTQAQGAGARQPQADKISRLIEQLGAEQYVARVRAQNALAELGLQAFDALHQAQFHDDIEIAKTAKYLVRSMKISWAIETDPADVRQILKGYAAASPPERRNRMERLSHLENLEGVPALCRLVRYESSSRLSKRAALLIITSKASKDLTDDKRASLAQVVTNEVGASQRPAAEWLRSFAATLQDPASALARWDEHTQKEQSTLAQFPNRSSREIARDLFRWQAALLDSLGRKEQALAIVRRTLSLLDGTQAQLMEMVDWLMERQAWALVEELSNKFVSEFSKNGLLLYRLAESQLKTEQSERAEETAKRALALEQDDVTTHIEAAYTLRDRGLMPWSIREFQHVMRISKPGTGANLYCRLLVSEILHDGDRDLEAAQALQGVVDVMDRPEVTRILTERWKRDPDAIKSRMNYFYALHETRADQQKARQRLEIAIKTDPHDPDVLIAMYRHPTTDAAWKKRTRKLIEDATAQLRADRKKYRRALKQAADKSSRDQARSRLAHADNQMAWLISNTFGDFDEALECSHESLELRPGTSAYLDTLGRCYYANGDFKNAVKYQAQAVKLEPHSAQIRRQLRTFQKALQAEQKKSKNDQ